MRTQSLISLGIELRGRFDAGDFTGRGQIRLRDGAVVDAERKARNVLADIDRITRVSGWSWLTDDEEQELHDDLLRLLASITGSVPA